MDYNSTGREPPSFNPVYFEKPYKPSDVVIYIGFGNYQLIPGDIFCIQSITNKKITLVNIDGEYELKYFRHYDENRSIQHYDKSEIDPEYGDWRIHELPNVNSKIRMRRINHLLTKDRLHTIKFEKIQWFGFDHLKENRGMNCICCGGIRTAFADINYPGLLLDGTKTYSGRRYRSMDGRHRIEKCIYFGYDEWQFFVVHIDEIIDYFQPM